MEVSGKGTLDFPGRPMPRRQRAWPARCCSIPPISTIGISEASIITRVLRTGTSTTLAADVDINVNSAIYGGDRNTAAG